MLQRAFRLFAPPGGKLVIDGNCPALTIRYTFLSPPSVELGVSLSQAFENIIIEWNGMSRNFLDDWEAYFLRLIS